MKSPNKITLLNGTDLRSWSGIRIILLYAWLFFLQDAWEIRVGLTIFFAGFYFITKALEVIYFRDRKEVVKKHLFKKDEVIPLSSVYKVIYYEIFGKQNRNHVRLLTKQGKIYLTETTLEEDLIILNDVYDTVKGKPIRWNEEIEKYQPFLESKFGDHIKK